MKKIEKDSQKFLIYIWNSNIELWQRIRTIGMGKFVNLSIEKYGQEFVDEHLTEK